ncbi:hypothetical protein ABH904_005048 [Pseudomonas frederiksbergensis]
MADAQIRELLIIELAQQPSGSSPFEACDERSQYSLAKQGFACGVTVEAFSKLFMGAVLLPTCRDSMVTPFVCGHRHITMKLYWFNLLNI